MRTIPLTLVAALLLGTCGRPDTNDVIPAAVEVAAVNEVAGAGGSRYSATVEPDAQIAVAFRVGGYVENVAVEEGDHVKKGAVLATIRRGDYVQKLGQATASTDEAEAALAQAKTNLDRARALYAANALTKPELDSALANVDMSEARVHRGRAAAGEAGLALGDTALLAPADGVILKRNVERGDLGNPGAVAFVLANTHQVKVMFGVPDMMIRSLKNGQSIDVMTESMPDRTFHATVARIAPAADPKTRNFDVELHIDNPANELKPGMVVSLEIARNGAPALAVPLDAVVRPVNSREGYAVFVIENSKAKQRNVTLGEPMGNLVVLQSGLEKGEQVIVSGPALLVDGQPVRVVSGGR